MSDESLILVELNLDRLTGHWAEYVPTLARAARDWRGEVVIVGCGTVAPDIRQRLSGCELVLLPDGTGRGRALYLWIAAILGRVYDAPLFRNGRARMTRRKLWLVRRCFTEAAALREVRRRWGDQATVALLTASEGLAATTAALSGTAHIRVVHEVRYVEGRVLAGIERALNRFARRVVQVCSTASVEADVRAKAVPTATAVRPFSVKDPSAYVSDQERREARRHFGIPHDQTVGCYVGGWWPGKDWDTAIAGIARTSKLDCIIIAGEPIDPARIAWLGGAWKGTVRTILRPLTSGELRRIYAASDCTLVCRHAGVTKESGLVMDAVRYGVHLVSSDHDPGLAEFLRGVAWASVFRCGDPESLAGALDAVALGVCRPGPADRDAFGAHTALSTLDFFAGLGRRLRD